MISTNKKPTVDEFYEVMQVIWDMPNNAKMDSIKVVNEVMESIGVRNPYHVYSLILEVSQSLKDDEISFVCTDSDAHIIMELVQAKPFTFPLKWFVASEDMILVTSDRWKDRIEGVWNELPEDNSPLKSSNLDTLTNRFESEMKRIERWQGDAYLGPDTAKCPDGDDIYQGLEGIRSIVAELVNKNLELEATIQKLSSPDTESVQPMKLYDFIAKLMDIEEGHFVNADDLGKLYQVVYRDFISKIKELRS